MTEKTLTIHPDKITAIQRVELHDILNISRAIFSVVGQKEHRDRYSPDTLNELVNSAPGGSFKKALKESLKPGNQPLLRHYDRASAVIPGFDSATVNLDMSLQAIDSSYDRRHREILILDRKVHYYEATISHLVDRKDPNKPVRTTTGIPPDELLENSEFRVTELFRYSDNPEDTIEHTLGIDADWYRPLGELNVDDSLERLASHIGHIIQPAQIIEAFAI